MKHAETRPGTTGRRQLAALALAGAPLAPARAQTTDRYPSRPVRVLVPFAPGGNADASTRIFADSLARQFGQSFVVENRGGAGGLIAGTAAARAEPDGYTVFGTTTGPVVSAWQLAGRNPAYSFADFRVAAVLNTSPIFVAVRQDSPLRNFDDLVRAAAARPGTMRWGHPGNGTTNHVTILQLQRSLGTEFVIAAYRGGGPAAQDLVAGQLDVVAADIPSVMNLIRAGTLRAIAVTSPQRIAPTPDVPTMTELGRPEVNSTNFATFMVPRATPDAVVDRIAEGVQVALADPAVQRQIEAIGTFPPGMTNAEFAAYLQRQVDIYAGLIQSGLLRNE